MPETAAATPVIDEILSGGGLSLARAARRLGVNASTVWRWARKGIQLSDGRRVFLEHARAGGFWMTSEAALARWMAAQTDTPPDASPVPRTAGQRARASDRAAAELEQAGL